MAGSLWATLRGSQPELFHITDFIDNWAFGLTPKGAARPVYMWRAPGELQVLGGVLSLLAEAEVVRGEIPHDFSPAVIRCFADHLVDEGIVRDYQADAAVAALCAPFGRGLVEVAMGGGKTYISALIAVLGATVGRGRWLYLVQNKELAQQSLRSFEACVPQMSEALVELGGDCERRLRREPAVLDATTYAGIRRDAVGGCYDGILVDECHLLPAPTRCVPFASVAASWRIGLSGTPLDRQDGANPMVIGLLGPVRFRITIDELESRGFLSRGRVQPVLFNRQSGVYR